MADDRLSCDDILSEQIGGHLNLFLKANGEQVDKSARFAGEMTKKSNDFRNAIKSRDV